MSTPEDHPDSHHSDDRSGDESYKKAARTHPILKALLVLGVLLGLAAAILLPAMGSAREAARCASCQSHLKQIGLALQNYLSAHGRFPPAYVADANGRPMHSWRALLLPYFEGADWANMYDLNEPWDGPHNRQLIERMPSLYGCPSDGHAAPGTTNYVAVVGPETMWPNDVGRTADEITDGLSNTTAIVEVTGLNIPWTEPRDLEFAKIPMEINPQNASGIRSAHGAGTTNVLFADGSVRFLKDVNASVLRALLTAAGDEPASPP